MTRIFSGRKLLRLWAVAAVMMLVAVVARGQAGQSAPAATTSAASPSSATPDAAAQSKPAASLPDLPDAPGMNAAPHIEPTGPTAVIDTSMGRITCKLYEKEAPVTVANFVGLAEGTKEWTDPVTRKKMHGKPFYDGTTFHRVIPDFMIQGGDPMGDGTGDAGYYFNDEIDPDLNFDVPGRLAMANGGPNTNGSQFFITESPQPSLDQHYNLFGQCDDDSVIRVKAIARVPRNPNNDKPYTPVVIRKITIVPNGQPLPPDPSAAAQKDQPESGAQKSPTAQR